MGTEQIREAQPIQNSIHDLIQTLSVKLDSAARYGLYVEDARRDGFEDCAELFARLSEQEQRAIDELLGCLQGHLADARPQ